ncbi:MAG: ABC transporter ATP-binding protein [Chloroflexota bacterium]|nr:MAG: spermidine/putrescine ABC transporter ATP-binding protein [Chloroflexota bacterium]
MRQVDVELRNVVKAFPTRHESGQLVAVDNVSLEIYRGEFFALLGPSGCGKTTTLRMIAGFEDATSGEILIRGQAVQNVPPFHRPVNTVFQDYALFPHMTVLENVMFGLEMEGVSKKEARKRAQEALEMVRLHQAEDRRPRQLSGGQQQRVALARALVKKPAVLLLDEPLGALDLKLRKALQYELAALQETLGITFIYVTHDQEEAMTMADRIAVMNAGRVLQVGTPEEIYETPATEFVADFIGETNFLRGDILEVNNPFAQVCLDETLTIKAAFNDQALTSGSRVTVAIRPEKVNLFSATGPVKYADGTNESPEEHRELLLRDPDINLVRGRVLRANYIGTDTRYVVSIGQNQQLVARVQNYGLRSDTTFHIDQEVYIFWDAEHSRVLTE